MTAEPVLTETVERAAVPRPSEPAAGTSPTAPEWALRRRVRDLLDQPLQPERLTYEEFLAWADEDILAEWVDGEVLMTSPASKSHQGIVDFLVAVLRTYVEARDLGTVIGAPFQMKLPRSGREPDLLFVAREHLARLKDTHLEGPADLAVEVVSPESAGRDRGDKFYEYEHAGIPEYWLVDPEHRRAEFYQLASDGLYQLVSPDEAGVYYSRSLPSFWLRVAWLCEPPRVLDALRELGVVS